MPKYYSNRELILRVLWGLAEPLLFRLTPDRLHGWRKLLLRMFGAKIGKRVQVFSSCRITYPWLLEIGDRSVLAWGVKVYNLGRVSIGSDTVISQHAHLCGGSHDYKSHNFRLLRTGLSVGSNVWIAADAFIGPGVNIADGSVVAARAVVVRDVAPLTVVAGNPAREIKKLEQPPPMHYGR